MIIPRASQLIPAPLGTAAPGTSGQFSDAGHTHSNTVVSLTASGLAGSTVLSRYIGATAGGVPGTGGPWLVGDWLIDTVQGTIYVCTTAGTVATVAWRQVGPSPTLISSGPFSALGGGTAYLSNDLSAAPGDHSHSAAHMRIYNSSTQSIPNVVDTALGYNVAEVQDVTSWWASGSPVNIVLPAGTFLLSGTVRFAGSATVVSERALWWKVGTVRYATTNIFTSAANQAIDLAVSTQVRVNSGTVTCNLMAWQSSGAALSTMNTLAGQRITVTQVG